MEPLISEENSYFCNLGASVQKLRAIWPLSTVRHKFLCITSAKTCDICRTWYEPLDRRAVEKKTEVRT